MRRKCFAAAPPSKGHPMTDMTRYREPGPLFSGLDFAAGIAILLMNLGPLAMAAFYAPYH